MSPLCRRPGRAHHCSAPMTNCLFTAGPLHHPYEGHPHRQAQRRPCAARRPPSRAWLLQGCPLLQRRTRPSLSASARRPPLPRRSCTQPLQDAHPLLPLTRLPHGPVAGVGGQRGPWIKLHSRPALRPSLPHTSSFGLTHTNTHIHTHRAGGRIPAVLFGHDGCQG